MLTSEESREIINCITIAAGARSLAEGDPLGTSALLQAVRRETATPDPSIERLTKREREVFDLLAAGVRNSEIASRLCVAVKTVDTHRTHIMRKMELASNSALVLWAVRHGAL